MKVLFISNYRDFSGWGDAAYNKILSMNSVGIDLYIRPIYFSNNRRQSELLDHLESKKSDKYDYIIQYTLPELYTYNGPAINIGNYECETTFTYSLWQKYINMMDQAWVSSNASSMMSFASNVDESKISVVPNSIDLNYYKNHCLEASIDELDQVSYNFYFVGELSKRKNISTMLRAFHTTFHPNENVNLVLKLNKPGYSPSQVFQKFEELNESVTNGLKIRKKYKKIICITDYLPRENLTAITKNLDCFITTSYGEGWCIPALEAVAMGHQLVYPKNSSIQDFAPKKYCYSFENNWEQCHGAVDTMENLYTARDYWKCPNFESICNAMRSAYDIKMSVDNKYIKSYAEKFSIENVGKIIKEKLECL